MFNELYRELFNVARKTASRHLKRLFGLEQVKKTDKGHYTNINPEILLFFSPLGDQISTQLQIDYIFRSLDNSQGCNKQQVPAIYPIYLLFHVHNLQKFFYHHNKNGR